MASNTTREMIKIGIISDTHNLENLKRVFNRIKRECSGARFIIHAGDIIHPQVIDLLSEIAPVKAILGNSKKDKNNFSFSEKKILKIFNYKIGIIHGLGNNPERILNWFLGRIGLGDLGMRIYYKRISRFFPNDIDCIVFGDLHRPVCKTVNKKLFFNPGSTDKEKKFEGSFGIIRFYKGKLVPKVIRF